MAQEDSTTCFSDFLLTSMEETSFITPGNPSAQENVRNVDNVTMEIFRYTNAQPPANIVSPTYVNTQIMKQNNAEAINLTSTSTNHQTPNRTQYFAQGTQVVSHNTAPFVAYPWNQNERPKNGYMGRQVPGQIYDGHVQTRSPNTGDGPNITHSACTPNPRQDYPITPPGTGCQGPNRKTASIPALTDYPGENGFEIYFGESTESAVKSAEYTHSLPLAKLFVKMNVLCPIQFRCSTEPPKGSLIRAMPVYIRSEHITEVVSRCPNHQIQDPNRDMSRHLIRAEQQAAEIAQYDMALDGRESVLVSYRTPDVGAQYSTVLYRFMCLSSCVGGINRRPIATVFTLETATGVVIGRRCVEIRVCSCPGRDRTQEEKRKRKNATDGYTILLPKKKKPFASLPSTSTAPIDNGKEEFFLRVKGREKFMILKKIKEALDLAELISPRQEEDYKTKEKSEETLVMREILNNYFKQARDKRPDDDGSSPFPT